MNYSLLISNDTIRPPHVKHLTNIQFNSNLLKVSSMKVITTDTTLRLWNYFSAPWKTHPEGCGNTSIANAYKVWYSFCSSAVLCTSDDKLLMDSFNCSLMPPNFEDFATKSKAKTKKWSSQSAATKVIAWQTWANNLTITAAISIWENKRLGKIFLRQCYRVI